MKRTAYLVTDHKEQSREFFIMGEGSSEKKYHYLRKLGIHNIDDMNMHLKTPMTPGHLAYCLCIGHIHSNRTTER